MKFELHDCSRAKPDAERRAGPRRGQIRFARGAIGRASCRERVCLYV